MKIKILMLCMLFSINTQAKEMLKGHNLSDPGVVITNVDEKLNVILPEAIK